MSDEKPCPVWEDGEHLYEPRIVEETPELQPWTDFDHNFRGSTPMRHANVKRCVCGDTVKRKPPGSESTENR